MRPRKFRSAALGASVAVLFLLATATPVFADYDSGISSYPRGANASWTVTRLSTTAAEINGRINDTVADGQCAYVKAWVAIDFAIDPATSKTVCGKGSSARFSVYGRELGTIINDRVQGILVKVCRRTSVSGSLNSCVTVLEDRQTF